MNPHLWPALAALFLIHGALPAQETAPAPAGEKSETAKEKAKEKDWLEFYYENPDPGRLVSEVKQWAEDGTLENEAARPAIIAFLSQVFRQNRDKIAGWHEQLAGLTAEQRQILHTAMLFSRTSEADALLREQFGKAYEEQKKDLPKILQMNLAQKNTLDMLWGFFYATGSKSAVRRVIWSFRFDAAPDNPDFAKIPENYRPLYKDLPESAAWTLSSNAKRHPKVLEICEALEAEKDNLIAPERRRLRGVLREFKPDKYPVNPPAP